MSRHTKSSRRAAFRRANTLPVRHFGASTAEARRFMASISDPGIVVLPAGEPLEPGQMATLGRDGRAYRAVR